MKLIVGLGNPGRRYIYSRHNIGFRILKEFGKELKLRFKKDKTALFLKSETLILENNVIFAFPLTYMNLSGKAVKCLFEKYKLSLEDLLVVHDDMDLELGRIKLVSKGGSAGHRGVSSIIDCLGTDKFCRLRIGIGKPKDTEPQEFVLQDFTPEEEKILKGVIDKAKRAILSWITEGIDKTMSIFNIRKKEVVT